MYSCLVFRDKIINSPSVNMVLKMAEPVFVHEKYEFANDHVKCVLMKH